MADYTLDFDVTVNFKAESDEEAQAKAENLMEQCESWASVNYGGESLFNNDTQQEVGLSDS